MTNLESTNENRKPFLMDGVERIQLVNSLETKVGILKMKIANGTVTQDEALALPELFEEYLEKGTSLSELKAFADDLEIALS